MKMEPVQIALKNLRDVLSVMVRDVSAVKIQTKFPLMMAKVVKMCLIIVMLIRKTMLSIQLQITMFANNVKLLSTLTGMKH